MNPVLLGTCAGFVKAAASQPTIFNKGPYNDHLASNIRRSAEMHNPSPVTSRLLLGGSRPAVPEFPVMHSTPPPLAFLMPQATNSPPNITPYRPEAMAQRPELDVETARIMSGVMDPSRDPMHQRIMQLMRTGNLPVF